MKNKFKIILASALLLCSAVSVLSACGNRTVNSETTLSSVSQTVDKATDSDKTSTINSFSEENSTTNKASESETTKKTASENSVEDIYNGFTVLTKTTPVIKGNTATIIIQGTPGAEYSIEFYETESKAVSYSGLENRTADMAGFASWTFQINESCEAGNRKIIVRENGSDKYIQTSIRVN